VSVFPQYQHSWWADADFNYIFERDDDTVKFGLNVYLGRLR
jgi:hypothetical protein